MHVPERRPQRQRQREREPRFLLPGQGNRRPQRAVVEFPGLRARQQAAGRFAQHGIQLAGAHPILRLRAAHRRGFLPLGNFLEPIDRLLAQGILPLRDQRFVADRLDVAQVFGLGHVREPRRPQLLDLFVVTVVVRRPQHRAAQAAARHAGERARRRLDFGFFDGEELVEVVVQQMRLRVGPLAENPLAFQTLHQRRARRAFRHLGRRPQLEFDQIEILAAQEAVGDFDQGKRPAAGLDVAHHQREPFAVRQERHLHVEARQGFARRPAIVRARPVVAARAAAVVAETRPGKTVAAFAARAGTAGTRAAAGRPESAFRTRTARTGAAGARAAGTGTAAVAAGTGAEGTAPIVPPRRTSAVVAAVVLAPHVGVFRGLAGPGRHEIQIQRKFRFLLRAVRRADLVVHAHVHSIAGFPAGKPRRRRSVFGISVPFLPVGTNPDSWNAFVSRGARGWQRPNGAARLPP